MGKHSKVKHSDRRRVVPKGMIEMVDARTGLNHLVTLDAAAASRKAPYRCLTFCATQIVPAALVAPETGYCKPCRSSTIIPAQRTRK